MFDKIKKLFVVEDDDPLKKALEQKSQAEADAVTPEEQIVPDRPASTQHSKPKTQTSKPTGGKVTDKFILLLPWLKQWALLPQNCWKPLTII